MEAVIFDCDGVLVDSERLCWEAWETVLARHGVELAEGDITHNLGLPDSQIADYFAARGSLPAPPLLVAELEEVANQLYATNVVAFADASALVHQLSAEGVPLAVASNGTRLHVDSMLAAADLAGLFAVSVAVDEVAQGKPAPDLYLEAARRLGVAPGRCIAIEDSPVGARAAIAAGMTTVGVARHVATAHALAHAHLVVHELRRDTLPRVSAFTAR